MTGLLRSWIESANAPGADFPLNNLPCGVFSAGGAPPRCGVAIGAFVLDLHAMETAGWLDFDGVLGLDAWNGFMARGPAEWSRLRERLTALLAEGSPAAADLAPFLVPVAAARLHMPFAVAEFTDFFSCRRHVLNVGALHRDPNSALPANWLHMPIAYNARASSVVVSGAPVARPLGQIKGRGGGPPRFDRSRRFDVELEIGAVVGRASSGPLPVARAFENIFGYVLLNDWSARDVQAWEAAPLGPFQSKATATTISPWIVTAAALEPFRVPTPPREAPLLPYLLEPEPMSYDIALELALTPRGGRETLLSRTNYREVYFSAAQQLAYHASCGCPMRVGDLLGSGTISGPGDDDCGSLLELSRGGRREIAVDGGTRAFVEDGDTVTLRGRASGAGYDIGFGACSGTVIAAESPFDL